MGWFKEIVRSGIRKMGYRVTRAGAANRFAAMDDALWLLRSWGYDPRVVIDGGANVGVFTQMARRIFPEAQFHLVEPQPACAPVLRGLAQRWPGVHFHQTALTRPQVRQVTLLGCGEGGGSTGAWVARVQDLLCDTEAAPYSGQGKFTAGFGPNFKEGLRMASRRLSDADLAAVRDLAKRWGKVVARQAFGPEGPALDVDLAAMEDVACAAAQGLTEGTVEHLLEQQAERLPAPHPCPGCGRACPVQHESRALHLRGATVEHREPVCHCPSCRRDFFPPAAGAAPGQPRLQPGDAG